MVCGAGLQEKYLATEGRMIPWCPECKEFRFPVFNTAVSMIVMNEAGDSVLLIRQYGKNSWILVAGYVNQGEDAEDAVRREVKEEMNLDVKSMHFNRSHYYAPSNTLMLNFTVKVEGSPKPDWEVDAWEIFSIAEARKNIRNPSLARDFLEGYFSGTYEFHG